MSRSRSRNLDAGYRLCELCGKLHHWSTVCVCSIQSEVDAIKAEAAAKKAEELRPGWIPVADSDGAISKAHALADEMVAKYNAAPVHDYENADTWDCGLCGTAQPGWAGDCLTCEQHGMMGDRD